MTDSEVDADRTWPDFGEVRSKVVTWHDPMTLAASAAGLTGLEFLGALRDGHLPPPPIASLLGMNPVSVTRGDVVFSCLPDESVYNPIGVVHGGLVCTLLDTVAACAVHSTLPVNVGYTSVEIKVSYLRPVRGGVVLTAHGWVTKPGRRVAFAEADVRDPSGAILATASSTCLVMG
jgi:uncharacterized protein (TIGR00369 family)